MVGGGVRVFFVSLALLVAATARAQPLSVDSAFRELTAAQTPPVDETVLQQAAISMVEAADADPTHRAAIVGLSNAAHAFATLGRWQSAERLWQRVIDEGGPRLDRQPQLEGVVAGALERLALRAARREDWSAAASAYRTLCDSERFARSESPDIQERIARAFVGAAFALEAQGAPLTAARYWLRSVERDPHDAEAADRLDHAARLFTGTGHYREAKEASEMLVRLFGRSRAHGSLVARARERIARGGAPPRADIAP